MTSSIMSKHVPPTNPARGGPPQLGKMKWGSSLAFVGRLSVAPAVLSAVHGDRTILLNLRTERYLGLDEVGTTVWSLVKQGGEEGTSFSALVDALHARYGAPREILEEDLGLLLNRLQADGVIVGLAPGSVCRSPSEPSALRCAFILVGAVLALRVLGLRRCLQVANWPGLKTSPVTFTTPEFLAAVVRKVDVAAAFFPGRALCLERSLALYALLRRSGVRARLRIGAQPFPFAAHAWVEHNGRPVGESHDRIGKFVPFKGLGL